MDDGDIRVLLAEHGLKIDHLNEAQRDQGRRVRKLEEAHWKLSGFAAAGGILAGVVTALLSRVIGG